MTAPSEHRIAVLREAARRLRDESKRTASDVQWSGRLWSARIVDDMIEETLNATPPADVRDGLGGIMELVEFLRARLDEDEDVARSVEDRSAPWDGQWVADGNDAARTFNGHVLFYGHNGPLKDGLVEHVTRHDPARVLREVEAKRELIRGAQKWEGGTLEFYILAPLAAVYADHPEYQQEWKP